VAYQACYNKSYVLYNGNLYYLTKTGSIFIIPEIGVHYEEQFENITHYAEINENNVQNIYYHEFRGLSQTVQSNFGIILSHDA
jgi:hypothetical protein